MLTGCTGTAVCPAVPRENPFSRIGERIKKTMKNFTFIFYLIQYGSLIFIK